MNNKIEIETHNYRLNYAKSYKCGGNKKIV